MPGTTVSAPPVPRLRYLHLADLTLLLLQGSPTLLDLMSPYLGGISVSFDQTVAQDSIFRFKKPDLVAWLLARAQCSNIVNPQITITRCAVDQQSIIDRNVGLNPNTDPLFLFGDPVAGVASAGSKDTLAGVDTIHVRPVADVIEMEFTSPGLVGAGTGSFNLAVAVWEQFDPRNFQFPFTRAPVRA